MDRCLTLPEILTLVFEELPPSEPLTLCSLVRTCKRFLAPAAKLLWREQSSLFPLLMTIPESFINQTGNSSILHAADWTRFNVYASSITKLKLSNVEPQVRQRIRHVIPLLGNSSLLPSLREFSALPRAILQLQSEIGYIFSPSVRKFSILGDSRGFLREGFSVRAKDERTAREIISRLVQQPLLRDVHVDRLLPEALLSLSKSTTLEHLKLDARREDVALIKKPAFPQLSYLNVSSEEGVEVAQKLLEGMDMTPLRMLCLFESQKDRPSSPLAWYSCIQTLSTTCLPSSLSFLHIEPQTEDPLDARFFQPLFAFHNLKTICVLTLAPLVVDDALIRSMVHAWPDLWELHLDGERDDEQDACVTLDGVLTLLERCPRIESIYLPAIDLSSAPSFLSQASARGIKASDMISLGVGYSAIEESEIAPVTALLKYALPNLAVVEFAALIDAGGSAGHNERWTRVQAGVTAGNVERDTRAEAMRFPW